MKARGIILPILLFTVFSVTGQKVDIFGISYTFNPNVAIKDPAAPALEDLNLNVAELDLKAFVPIRLKNDHTTLINRLRWSYVNAFFDELPQDYIFEADLHAIDFTFGVNHALNEKWGFVLLATPTLASNFRKGISGDDFYLQGSAIVYHTLQSGFRIGAGAAYTGGFGEPQLLPALRLAYQTDQFDLDVIVPVRINATYQMGNLVIGLKSDVEGNEYNLNTEDRGNNEDERFDKIKFSRLNIGPVVGWIIGNHSRLEISGGVSLNRVFKVVNSENEETDHDLKSGVFIRAGYYFGKQSR